MTTTIEYSPATKMYTVTVNGREIGSAANYADADELLKEVQS